ncbi:MAG: periplasmic sensor signal transduction histidine kinase [Candidatus Ozemobacter sibiricus]|uniref:histidine kinase n=1 Tax=Candidatus Ozemobacter sibiricus TaxID=2268124 RepID=A0A367ZP60_9BACT|nr:MAG: periplasmic sensor signal transduction histidine kinase [Candidatus Ozemobacter sibiricus]
MNERGRQAILLVLLAALPAILLVLTFWAYHSLMESMASSLLRQRAMALTKPGGEGVASGARSYPTALLATDGTRLLETSPDWPADFDAERLYRLRQSYGPAAAEGIELSMGASGPVLVWVVPVEDGYRVAVQGKRAFFARLESMRVLIWTAGLLLTGGGFLLFVFLARRLSEVFLEMEMKNQELERANRHLEELGTLKSTFLALVSHELRTPLARLVGHANLIRQQAAELPEEIRKRFDEMTVEIEELGRMTKNALDLTRLQSEDLAARLTLGQIDGLVRAVAERVRPLAVSRRLTLEVETAPTPPVNHDPYLLERILDNLLVNATKYSPEGGRIAVSMLEDGDTVQIRVENTGIPIPAADRDRIFEKFFRLEGGPDVPGTGLGLYLVRQFILMMNGRVWVEPLEDGNRFIVTLPLG